jgi:hypothetical protein
VTLPTPAAFLLVLTASCTSARVPDPRAAALAYADAAARGDADALYAILTRASRLARGRDDVRKVVSDERDELAEQAKELRRADVHVEATARMRYADGEEAALQLAEGHYRVTAAGALPGGALTPEAALEQLRRVLARRSYAGLLRVLSAATRSSVENDLRSLVDGLNEPQTLDVKVSGDEAQVPVPGGHHVKLKRDSGIWRVEDFD